MQEIRLRVPRVPAGLGANMLGLAGLGGVAYFSGALLGSYLWSGLIGSVFAVGLAWLAGLRSEMGQARPRPVTVVKPVTAKVG